MTIISQSDARACVKAVSDRHRNPFGIDHRCDIGDPVIGYGDPAADFHVIGEHPGRHGGAPAGIPFTSTTAGAEIRSVLFAAGLLDDPNPERPVVSNLFMNYLYACPVETDRDPSAAAYAERERFFDAELRAVNAHILLPVGKRATDHVLKSYTTRYRKEPQVMVRRHATEIRGRGFLVVPIADPTEWREDDRERIIETVERILASDYRQTKGVATLVG